MFQVACLGLYFGEITKTTKLKTCSLSKNKIENNSKINTVLISYPMLNMLNNTSVF
jgi:hypothetical protein